LKVKVAGIKWTAEPVEQLLVFCVLRIVNSLQEVVVAKDATAVFWRTGVLSIQANRTLFFRISSQNFFHDYFVFPAIAKIVFVN
jgi:hypothetical protein